MLVISSQHQQYYYFLCLGFIYFRAIILLRVVIVFLLFLCVFCYSYSFCFFVFLGTSNMDANDDKISYPKLKFSKTACGLCEHPGPKLFRIPSNENMHKKWFAVLKWNIPPQQLKYVLNNARVCDKHFSESCFSSTLRTKLLKFACPDIIQDMPSASNIPSLPSTESQDTSVEVSDSGAPCLDTRMNAETLHSESFMDVEPTFVESIVNVEPSESIMDAQPSFSKRSMDTEPSKSFALSPTHNSSVSMQVTPKTKKIKNLRSSISKLKRKLYEKGSSTSLLGQLKAKLADKPYLYDFVTSQLRTQSKNSKGRRWSAKEKTFALQIYLHSPSAYKLLRKYFAFPSKATLHRYTYNIARRPGFCGNLVKCLKSQTSRMSESERFCTLLIDEMSIKPGLMYNKDLDCVNGFSTVKKDSKFPPLATNALVFMARGIIKNWKQILGYHFTPSSATLKETVHEAIEILHSCELEVVSIVCDQGPINQGLFKELKITKKAPFFFYNSKKIFAMYDPPHLLKSVRNNLKNHGIYFQDKVASLKPRTCYADWDHIKKLYEMDSKKKMSACRRLTKTHIEVSGLKKLNVKLAAQVLSHSVAAALNLYVKAGDLDSKASETSEFVYNVDKLFDSVNARTLHSEKKEMCAVSEISGHIEMWKKLIPWIAKWQIISRTTGKPLYVASKTGWIITLKAFIGISEVLLKKMKFILTGRFSQDALENTFASIRRRGGFRDNPDVNEFCQQTQKVIISNFIKQSENKNCQDDEAHSLIDFSCFNKNELLEVIDSDDCVTESENLHDVDGLNFSALDNIEENVLSYISGYLAKKYLSLNDCIECGKLMVDDDKILTNHTVLLYFKEYDDSKSGLKWPTADLFQYFVNLHECFLTNFNLFFDKKNISKKFSDVLSKVEIEFFNDHLEHKEKAQMFFITSFVRMMIRHKIKMMNDDFKLVIHTKKKLKYAPHL